MGEYGKIEIFQSVIEDLAKKPEEDVRRILPGGLVIDGQRMQAVLRFREQGFLKFHFIVERLIAERINRSTTTAEIHQNEKGSVQ
jgi:hypothetical protein